MTTKFYWIPMRVFMLKVRQYAPIKVNCDLVSTFCLAIYILAFFLSFLILNRLNVD